MHPERHLLTVKLNLTQSQTSSSVKNQVCFDFQNVELVKTGVCRFKNQPYQRHLAALVAFAGQLAGAGGTPRLTLKSTESACALTADPAIAEARENSNASSGAKPCLAYEKL